MEAAIQAVKPASELFTTKADGEVHKEHPFFMYYAQLPHQQNMLQDSVRVQAYNDAVMRNAADFAGKVVLDVGTGSGILAFFAAKAGARKVYAVEASGMADLAKRLMAANGMSDRIEVIKSKIETLELPEKVDVIISEPIGFMLVHERMIESYVIARDKFLAPGGKMYPSSGIIRCCPFTDATLHSSLATKAAFWDTADFYGLDLRALKPDALRDNFSQAVVGQVDPASLLAGNTCDLTLDFTTALAADLHKQVLPFDFTVTRTGLCHGMAAWFDILFDGSTERVVLTTAPSAPITHWWQCRILLQDPLALNAGQRLVGTMTLIANERYSYHVALEMRIAGSEATCASGEPIRAAAFVDLGNQMYNY